MEKEKDLGGELTDYPNDKWKKFFESFKEIETLEVSKWRPAHVLAYFNKKYYQAYNTKYQFKFNSPSPVKSFEIFQIKRLAMLLSSSPQILRDYIDWVFQEKVANNKRKLTSISFMTHEDLIKTYKVNFLFADKKDLYIDRSTALQSEFKNIMQSIGPINTYGDLAFMYQSYKAGAFDEVTNSKFSEALNNLQVNNFDLTILDRIK